MTPEREGSVDEESLAPGTLLRERYQVLVWLGSGGMGIVYRARDLTLGRDVALKVMRSAGDAALRARFRREAQLASRVHHPHTVYVIDVGELPDGRGFLAMELLQGETLRAALLAHGRLDPARACRIGAMIASGMQSVHEAGIIHRDLKPANIFLLDKEGTRDFVKIVDFGVAKELDLAGSSERTAAPGSESGGGFPAGDATAQSEIDPSLAALTRNGSIIGTPRYMAPEQLRGEVIDARADQYALGCILYEVLTGAPPFAGGAQQVARGHLYGDPVAPRVAQPQAQISKELEAIVLRAMSRQPEARFPQMRALAAALKEEAERLQHKSLRPSQPGVPWRTVSLGALAAAALGAVAIPLVRGRQAPRLTERVPDAQALRPALRENARGGPGPEGAPARVEPAARAPEISAPEISAPPVAPAVRAPSESAAASRKKAGPARVAVAAEPQRPAAEPIADLVAGATAALRRGDAASSLRLLSSARQRCARAASTSGCAEHSAQIAVSLGRLNEAEGHWAEALAEYSRALGAGSGAAPAEGAAWRQEAEAATVRLASRLGRVFIKRSRGGRCEEVSMFLPPGEHQLEIEGQRQLITIRARETLRLGRCAEP